MLVTRCIRMHSFIACQRPTHCSVSATHPQRPTHCSVSATNARAPTHYQRTCSHPQRPASPHQLLEMLPQLVIHRHVVLLQATVALLQEDLAHLALCELPEP